MKVKDKYLNMWNSNNMGLRVVVMWMVIWMRLDGPSIGDCWVWVITLGYI